MGQRNKRQRVKPERLARVVDDVAADMLPGRFVRIAEKPPEANTSGSSIMKPITSAIPTAAGLEPDEVTSLMATVMPSISISQAAIQRPALRNLLLGLHGGRFRRSARWGNGGRYGKQLCGQV